MRKIFDKYGWKWSSNFFESETFENLIIPFGKEKITTGPAAQRKFSRAVRKNT